MSAQIGETAGKVWRFLDSKGPSTVGQIQKGIGADAVLTNQALGWLAREGKISVDRSKRYPKYSLNG